MWEYIEGDLIEARPSHVVIAAGGFGYYLHTTLQTYQAIQGQTRTRLFLSHRIRDEHIHLYGFATAEEREYFQRLLRISGVGTAMALSILSAYSTRELEQIIRNNDLEALVRVKKIGKKTAGRILVDFQEAPIHLPGTAVETGTVPEAIQALEMLGFSRKEARRLVDTTRRKFPDLTSPEAIVTHILRNV